MVTEVILGQGFALAISLLAVSSSVNIGTPADGQTLDGDADFWATNEGKMFQVGQVLTFYHGLCLMASFVLTAVLAASRDLPSGSKTYDGQLVATLEVLKAEMEEEAKPTGYEETTYRWDVKGHHEWEAKDSGNEKNSDSARVPPFEWIHQRTMTKYPRRGFRFAEAKRCAIERARIERLKDLERENRQAVATTRRSRCCGCGGSASGGGGGSSVAPGMSGGYSDIMQQMQQRDEEWHRLAWLGGGASSEELDMLRCLLDEARSMYRWCWFRQNRTGFTKKSQRDLVRQKMDAARIAAEAVVELARKTESYMLARKADKLSRKIRKMIRKDR